MISLLMLITLLAFITILAASASDSPSTSDQDRLFAMDNLVAWCIIPYDNQDRTPLQRAGMLRELGFTRMGYDWRERHLPDFPEEIRTLQKFDIELTSVWLWIDDRAADGLLPEHNRIFDALEDAGVSTSIWIGLHENVYAGLRDAQKVAKVAGIIDLVYERARKSGSSVSLYNHGGWAGVPENQVRIIRASKYEDIGIVFNFHHGHDQIESFGETLEILMPWLETVNLNGMEKDGAHIVDIGKGDHEKQMIKTLLDSGFTGNIGIIGHTEGEDVRDVLLRNLHGLHKILEELEKWNTSENGF